jgi:2-polyprenyl-6-methoxyphenol hydroxylase-like FAD-dependent oxidoreductase
MQATTQSDVIVVGAGPTGLMLANQLARRGVRVSIIDRHQGPSIQTKALGVQARTMEIYSHLGIAERALELGLRATGANLWVNGRRAARVPLGDIGRDLSPYPFLLILGQDDNERLLGEKLRQLGVDIQWNTELVGLAQQSDHVVATLKQPDGTTRDVKTGWMAGCDGARSAVRTLNAIDFAGAPYEHVFFVADTTMTGPMVPGELNIYLWREGFHLLFPMHGADHWRIVGILPRALSTRGDLDFQMVAPSVCKEAGAELKFQECRWFSTYRIHHRRAVTFHDRRCFLLGDAAHIHSPVGAQGMNTGLQDAYNLGWKLALVVQGRADQDLLDTYEAERMPIAKRLLKTTDRAFSLIVSDHWLAGIFRTRLLSKILAHAMTIEEVRRLAFLTISQIGIHYRSSPLSETFPGVPRNAPQAGERFPWMRLTRSPNMPAEDVFTTLDDTRFNLIVIGQAPPPAPTSNLADLLLIHHVPDDPVNDQELARVKISKPSFYLLRPDGHIGVAGARLDVAPIIHYLRDHVGLHMADRQ